MSSFKDLYLSSFNTKLGEMIAIADDDGLYLLEFINNREVNSIITKLKLVKNISMIKRKNKIITSINLEIKSYFNGTLKVFITPIHLLGSSWQKLVWENLKDIPYGVSKSYKEQPLSIGKNKAYRAVAHANAANKLAIIIPCHRIILSNGQLGGYNAGYERKQWLLAHEQDHL